MPPSYLWECSMCGVLTGVVRPMAEHKIPPDEVCLCPEGVVASWVRHLEPVAITNGDGHKPAPPTRPARKPPIAYGE